MKLQSLVLAALVIACGKDEEDSETKDPLLADRATAGALALPWDDSGRYPQKLVLIDPSNAVCRFEIETSDIGKTEVDGLVFTESVGKKGIRLFEHREGNIYRWYAFWDKVGDFAGVGMSCNLHWN